jgi:hypothetical protein
MWAVDSPGLCAVEAPPRTVVATDRASVDADCDIGVTV